MIALPLLVFFCCCCFFFAYPETELISIAVKSSSSYPKLNLSGHSFVSVENKNFTLYNVYSVHRGCSIHRGIPWVHRGISWVHRGCSVHRGDTMSTSGDVQYIGEIPWCMRGGKVIKPFNLYWKPRCTHDIPHMHHDIPPMYLWYPPDVLMVSLWCTHGIPPMYWTSPDALNTHYTGWFLNK